MESLVFYDYLAYTALTALSFGAVAPRSSDDLMVQVLNTSNTYQATGVGVVIDGTDGDQMFVSVDGESFFKAAWVGDIPPGSGCAPFWLRRVTASTATGSFSASLTATPTAWTEAIDTSTTDNIGLGTGTEIDLPDIAPIVPDE